MVDYSSFTKMNPDSIEELFQPHQTNRFDEVPESELYQCASTVLGYSFAAKKWGHLVTDKFRDIVWNTNAFKRLVLAQEKKTLIKSLIYTDRTEIITDIVSCKAGGSIVILHGKPG